MRNSYDKQRIVGLTGGIGSGKSEAARILRSLGAHTLDADRIVHTLLEPKGICYVPMVALFGKGIVLPNGDLDRKEIARLAFANDVLRLRMNAIIHPAVLDALRRLSREIWIDEPNAVVVWEVPLLFESGYDREVGHCLLITAPEALRVARLMQSRGYTKEQALERIATQMPDAEKIVRARSVCAHSVLANDGDLRILEESLRQWLAAFGTVNI